MKKIIIISAVVIIYCSCDGLFYGYKYSTGSFPLEPRNFAAINTEYDDYNSTAPTEGETFPLCFSSNRNSNGGDFDIIYKLITIEFSKNTGKLDVFENNNTGLNSYTKSENLTDALKIVNTSHNELGPYLYLINEIYRGVVGEKELLGHYYLLYANNEHGDYDIKFTHNTISDSYDSIYNANLINSAADDLYPVIHRFTHWIYWSSNRDGNFNIYKTRLYSGDEYYITLSDIKKPVVILEEVLSSESDDKCPYIQDNFMVFASNRAGGYGGYDLYYSIYKDEEWTIPENFGEGINSEYDEFRPIVRPQRGFDNDFMLFSSNKPGGKGGFDLYYVGINKIRELTE